MVICGISIAIIAGVALRLRLAEFKPSKEGLIPTLHVGDQWVFTTSGGTNYIYTIIGEEEVDGKSCYVLEKIVRNPPPFYSGRLERYWVDKNIWDPVGVYLKVVRYVDNENFGWSTILEYPEGYPFPLKPGKEYKIIIRLKDDNISPLVLNVKIEEIEEISVPAGNYRSYKIVCSSYNTVESIVWYSDEVKFKVKEIIYPPEGVPVVYELLSYSIQD
jgi:hypothetical protein